MLDIKKMLTKISKQMKEEKMELSSQYIDACSITKSGNVVQLIVYNVKNIPNQTSTLLTIPEGLRPIGDVPFDLIQPRTSGATMGYFLRCTARADGRLTIYNYSGSAISGSTNCAGSVTYIVETGGVLLKGSIFKAFSHRRKAVASC